jgi:hypothetical protein
LRPQEIQFSDANDDSKVAPGLKWLRIRMDVSSTALHGSFLVKHIYEYTTDVTYYLSNIRQLDLVVDFLLRNP